VLQSETGYRVEVITVRKLEYETDPFTFSEKVRPAGLTEWMPGGR
jgi:hypothetical protein